MMMTGIKHHLIILILYAKILFIICVLREKKYKVNASCFFDLHLILYGIKINLKVFIVC